MDKFFNPSSIAVIGASRRRGGSQTIKNLQFGYSGKIYPVNPGYDDIHGIPCFSSLDQIPSAVDLAIILVPAPKAPDVLKSCAAKGIKRVMIESAGFSETGAKGKDIQDKCVAIAGEAGIRIWGPNCMGLVDVKKRYFFTFMSPRIYQDGIQEGRFSMVVQSGMLSAGFLVDLLSKRNIGVNKICSIGNKAGVDECDMLTYLLNDPDTNVVALYLESAARGRELLDIIRRASKPIVVLKGGKSERGAMAAVSHTASLAGDSRLLCDILGFYGITLADDFHQMIDLARSLAVKPRIRPAARLGVVSFSGAAGIVSCDLLERRGLAIARLSPETEYALKRLYPDWMPVTNPVDLYPAMELHWHESPVAQAIAILLKDPNVDVILLHFVAGLGGEELHLAELKRMADQAGKVIVLWLLGKRNPCRDIRVEADKCGMLVFDELSRAVECISAASRYRPYETSPGDMAAEYTNPFHISADLLPPEGGIMDEYHSKRLLKYRDVPVVEEEIVTTVSEAKDAADRFGFPVVLKGLMPGVLHKTELGLVKPGIEGRKGLAEAFGDLTERLGGSGRIIIQPQVRSDFELIAGFIRDAHLGPCVMFGLGGIFSEFQKDVRFAPAPLSHQDALRLISRIRGNSLFEGFRGMSPLRKDVMAGILVSLGALGAGNQAIEQIDINPLAVSAGLPVALDATIVLAS
ncbi:CoA-binding domain protein [uncultured Desulfobacterium sp.]|uniref:CoA-binding domain protein n=1 Tax=uncultured Desulfobacterium sp. TaxID=201089 RepID=A0A445MYD3_9BACT|nr:CoA-binding domain protein [uncultured Desulfobacterium sp.]